jgi:hypothetical protein
MNAATDGSNRILELEHYLTVLERKPGASAGSKPLVCNALILSQATL